jgi:hypothetical protein
LNLLIPLMLLMLLVLVALLITSAPTAAFEAKNNHSLIIGSRKMADPKNSIRECRDVAVSQFSIVGAFAS